ncbi:hypothetical protein MAR_027478 [Mya arenaria]|uniref:Uncharacterized protein n=1 Tax=Mya arenaria TaxID=6604 RepID=A0ABY7EXP4_MYAAR|nr:hypothetical protein MAR_027478 [Mya arenaria]
MYVDKRGKNPVLGGDWSVAYKPPSGSPRVLMPWCVLTYSLHRMHLEPLTPAQLLFPFPVPPATPRKRKRRRRKSSRKVVDKGPLWRGCVPACRAIMPVAGLLYRELFGSRPAPYRARPKFREKTNRAVILIGGYIERPIISFLPYLLPSCRPLTDLPQRETDPCKHAGRSIITTQTRPSSKQWAASP